MTIQWITKQVQDILAAMGISSTALSDNTNFSRDLGLDSLDIADLLIQVETRFSIRIPDQDWWLLQTMGQLNDYLFQELTFEGDERIGLSA